MGSVVVIASSQVTGFQSASTSKYITLWTGNVSIHGLARDLYYQSMDGSRDDFSGLSHRTVITSFSTVSDLLATSSASLIPSIAGV